MEEILWLLADRPDHAHLRVGDLVVAGVGRGQLLPEGDRCLSVLLKADGGREVVGAAPHDVVAAGSGSEGLSRDRHVHYKLLNLCLKW